MTDCETLSIAQTARLLGCSEADVRKRIGYGQLRAVDGPDGPRVLTSTIHQGAQLDRELASRPSPEPPSGIGLFVDLLWSMGMLGFVFALMMVGFLAPSRDGLPLPWPIVVGGLAVWLAGLAWYGDRTSDLDTINGIGTKLYGHAPTRHGIVATRFLVFLSLPLVPLRSYVLLSRTTDWEQPMSTSTRYALQPYPEGRFLLRQAMVWPASSWLGIVAVFGLFAFLGG